MARLDVYRAKRNFRDTPEPAPGRRGRAGKREPLQYVIQKHHASHLHYDFRLELEGTLKSWAVPKGPSLDPADKRLAVHVEDHPLEYGKFEGRIPEGNYGAGEVVLWDRGTWRPVGDAPAGYREGKLKFELLGEKLRGHWTLVRTRLPGSGGKEQWLLIKEEDAEARPRGEYDITEARPHSVNAPGAASRHGLGAVRPRKAKAREQPAAAAKPASRPAARKARAANPLVGGVAISHAERIVDPASGLSKLDVVRYYESVAELILPHLRGRPVALVRAPEGLRGEQFFQKHVDRLKIPGVRVLPRSLAPKHPPMMAIESAQALISAAQMGTLELHTWNAVTTAIEKPDRVVFDLDPDPALPWARVVEAAELIKTLLDELRIVSFLKTSGGRGLHVVVPLQRRHTWEAAKGFSQKVAEHLAATIPSRFSAKMGKQNRIGKVFVDYLRNTRGSSTVCAWSVRARPGLPVSVPVAWEELVELKSSADWNISNALQRAADAGDPWKRYEKSRQTLTGAIRRLEKL